MTKRAYQQKLEAQLREWQAKIDRLKQSTTQASGDRRREFEHRIEDLQAKQKAARRKLSQLDQAGKSIQQETQKGLHTARHKLRRTIRRLVSGSN